MYTIGLASYEQLIFQKAQLDSARRHESKLRRIGYFAKLLLYADNFPVWSEHSTAIAQFAVWTALAEANVGASLQHYNPVVDEAAAKEWSITAHNPQ